MDLRIEKRSDLLDVPPELHSCHDIEHWYINTPLTHCINTSIFVDCAHTCHARWTYHTHHKFALHAWIDSHYDCLVASCIPMSSMIHELVHFLSKFVVIYLDGIFIHNDHIAFHKLHDNIHILSIHCHIHAIDKPSHYDIILHRGCIDHIYNTFVCTMIAFPPMNALHLILDHLDNLHALCHDQSCRTDSFLHDGHFVCANHCIPECCLCLLFFHVYHSGDTLDYLDCAMSSTSSNYKSVYDNRFHGDEDHDPRSDLSQGGEMMRSIPRSSPCTLRLLSKPHTPSDTR